MTPTRCAAWLLVAGVLASATLWSVVQGAPSLLCAVLTLAVAAMLAYQVWSPWQGPRRWFRLRYHSPDPPDPVVLQRSLAPLLGHGAIVLRWLYGPDTLRLWIEIPAHLRTILPPLLATGLPDLHLEADTPPPVPATRPVYRWPLTQAGTGHPTDPLDFAQTLLRLTRCDQVGELRLILFQQASACLLALGEPAVAGRPAAPVRWLPDHPALARLRAWVIDHYPWGNAWPTPSGDLPLMQWPPTDDPRAAGMDTHGSYHIPLTPPLPAMHPPYLELGTSTVTGQPVLVSLDDAVMQPPAIWQGHFLSIGRADERLVAIQRLARQALAWGARVVAIDPTHTLIPQISIPLIGQAAHTPTWINRNHPRGSLRLNLLAVTPDPTLPPAEAAAGALHLALTSALPLFDQFLARLGIAPWSVQHGDILIHDITLVLLVRHHRSRMDAAAPDPPPTPYDVYQQLYIGDDVRGLLAEELEAWGRCSAARGAGLRPDPGDDAIYMDVRGMLEAALARWEAQPNAFQEEARQRLYALLQPVFDHPGLQPFWHGAATAPDHYFNHRPPAITFTHLLPPNAGSRDHALAQWYAEYLLLCVVAAAHARRQRRVTAPPVLLLLDNLPAWWDSTLLGPHLPELGAAGIACAATGTHLPPAPDGHQILRAFGTWWLYALDTAEQAAVTPYLRGLPEAEDLPLAHFQPGTALLRVARPHPAVGTVYTGAHEEDREEEVDSVAAEDWRLPAPDLKAAGA